MTEEIINGNSKNIGYRLKKRAVQGLERKSKIVNDFALKILCGPLLKEHRIF